MMTLCCSIGGYLPLQNYGGRGGGPTDRTPPPMRWTWSPRNNNKKTSIHSNNTRGGAATKLVVSHQEEIISTTKEEEEEENKYYYSLAAAPAGEEDSEELIEKVIYRCRFLTILAVLGSLMGSIICFLKGCGYVIDAFALYFSCGPAASGGRVIPTMIEAIDVYLIGTVMLVFGMGLYELFISNLDIAKTSSQGSNLFGLFKLTQRPKWLKIESVDELKTKLGHVIVMVLLVGMFEKSKKVTIASTTDLLCFAASILLSSTCLYLLSKLHSAKHPSSSSSSVLTSLD